MKRIAACWAGICWALWGGVGIAPASYDNDRAKVRFLDRRLIDARPVDGIVPSELSDLAYDASRRTLYMIGDEGKLFAFEARFGERIEHLRPLQAGYLRNAKGKRLKRPKRDSEGMCLDAKGRLAISFEGKPRVAYFATDAKRFGYRTKHVALPRVLRKAKRYRSKNKALEALAYHPRYGLLTAPEWPLKKLHKKCHTIYALRSNKRWCFRAEPEARSGVVAMEVTDDGNVLVLERSFRGLLEPLIVTLKKVYLSHCNRNGICRSEIVVKMNTHQGWDIDNFEGLAKVGKHRYVMVSDDNENFFQRSMLVYMEVRP